ncbi:Lcl domain-containing protein [Shewanella xiamenensis]|uniref:Lcl domain-containing protein n=1 Tax=Shewanella xiamenensis TaxID=332186 RepID=UPI001184F5B2|nr:DUF1566 domain-containing protein [Shewanella xiamenensis]
MMRYLAQLPIWRSANRLLLEIEQAVRGFSRDHKYTIGQHLRETAMRIGQALHRAFSRRNSQIKMVQQVAELIDDIKMQIQLAKELHAFHSFGCLLTLTMTIFLFNHKRNTLMRKRKLLPTVVTAAACLLASGHIQASSLCAGSENTAITATTPSADFTDNGDGTVTHHTTGLIWQRCSLGQSWDGVNCTGEATNFTWKQALAAGAQNTLAGFSDWRLPNKNELTSIVEYRCHGPAINNQQFPNTSSSWYWSSSPYASHSYGARGVDFYSGGVSYYEGYYGGHVRLVRAGQ